MESMDRRNFLAGSAKVIGGGLLLGAATPARGLAAANSASSAGSVTISMWADGLSPSVAHWHSTYVFPTFKKKYPSVNVQYINKGPDEPQALQTALAGGGGPTIVYEDPTYLYGFEKAGYLIPLDQYAAKYNWKDKFLSWALSTGKLNGRVYTVPERLESMIMYYSPDTFAKYGWSIPKNYAQLVELCQEASKAHLIPMAGGSSDWHPATEWWLTSWWNAFAGPKLFYEALVGQAKFSDEPFVEGVANLKYFFDKKWIAGGAARFFATQSGASQSQVANGQAALGPNGTWSFADVATYFPKGFNWDWALLPPLSGHASQPVFPLSVGALVGINKNSSRAEQDAAAAFINYYEADPVVSANGLANAGRELGSLRVSAKDFPANTAPQMKRFYEQLLTESNKGAFGFATWTFLPAATDVYLYKALENVLVGSLSPKDYCRNIQKQFDKDKKARNAKPAPKPTAFL